MRDVGRHILTSESLEEAEQLLRIENYLALEEELGLSRDEIVEISLSTFPACNELPVDVHFNFKQ